MVSPNSASVNSELRLRTVIINVSPRNAGIAKLEPRNDLGIHAIKGALVPKAKEPPVEEILSVSLHPLTRILFSTTKKWGLKAMKKKLVFNDVSTMCQRCVNNLSTVCFAV